MWQIPVIRAGQRLSQRLSLPCPEYIDNLINLIGQVRGRSLTRLRAPPGLSGRRPGCLPVDFISAFQFFSFDLFQHILYQEIKHFFSAGSRYESHHSACELGLEISRITCGKIYIKQSQYSVLTGKIHNLSSGFCPYVRVIILTVVWVCTEESQCQLCTGPCYETL